jgi:hypothetical protein
MSSGTAYELLPRSSADLDSADSYKEKPRPSRRPLRIASALARKLFRSCKPLYFLVAFVAFLLWQLAFNSSYISSDKSWEKGLVAGKDDTVFIAANIIDGELINGAWGRSLLQLVEMIGQERVFVSIFGGPTDALAEFAQKLECGHELVSEAVDPINLESVPKTTLPTGEQRIKRIAYLAEVRNKALEPLEKLGKEGKRFNKVLFINDVFFDARDALRLLWATNLDTSGVSRYKAACGVDFITSWKMYDTYATRDLEGYSIGVPIFPWFANVGNDAQARKDVLAGRAEVRVKSCWGGIVAFDGRYFETPPSTEKSILPSWMKRPSQFHPPRDISSSFNSTLVERNREERDLETRVDTKFPALPLRFRSEPEPFWDASECCLIHADILALPPFPSTTRADLVTPDKPLGWEDGIFMNPYVRVAYDASTFSWIPFAKRFERLFSPLQQIITHLAHLPRWNYRRIDRDGVTYKDKRWVSNTQVKSDGGAIERRATLNTGKKSNEEWAKEGHYEEFDRVGTRGGYCGVRQLLVLKKKDDEGEGNWDNLLAMVPPLDI